MYAQINLETKQMIGTPVNLPISWVDASGATINRFNMLSNTVLYSFGWVPVSYEELPHSQAYFQSTTPVFDEETKSFVYKAIPKDINTLKECIYVDIDEKASLVCAKYISTGAGQEMRYIEKYNQATLYMKLTNDQVPFDLEQFPILVAEATECGITTREKAEEVLNTYNKWVTISAQIEALRIGGKLKVRNSINRDTIMEIWKSTVSGLEVL